jgi:hypothetical protein
MHHVPDFEASRRMTCQQCQALNLGIEIPVTTRAFRATVIAHPVACEPCRTIARDVCLPTALVDLTFAPLWTNAVFINPEFIAIVGRASRAPDVIAVASSLIGRDMHV